MHPQIELGSGVYVTDYRKSGELKGIGKAAPPEPKDVPLILDKCYALESKIQKLMFSVEAIQQQENWQSDQDFLEAISENYQKMLKFSNELKQSILFLSSLNYKPETQKIEILLDPNRIMERSDLIASKLQQFSSRFGKKSQQNSEHGKCNKEQAQQQDDQNGIYV